MALGESKRAIYREWIGCLIREEFGEDGVLEIREGGLRIGGCLLWDIGLGFSISCFSPAGITRNSRKNANQRFAQLRSAAFRVQPANEIHEKGDRGGERGNDVKRERTIFGTYLLLDSDKKSDNG